MYNSPLIRVREVVKNFNKDNGRISFRRKKTIRAVDHISCDIHQGETLGLVGESGCGKTTLGRVILNLTPPTQGQVYFKDENISKASKKRNRSLRKDLQIIFQDPFGSLNPRMSINEIIRQPLLIHKIKHKKKEATAYIDELLAMVGLDPVMAGRYPHEFSGGQRQRIGIARALALNPSFIVLDEPVSAQDVSIQAQIINLLQALQEKFGLTYLFIAHDLAVVKHISDRVAVMYLGRIVEIALREILYSQPLHPYTKALMSAVPIPDPELEAQRAHIELTGEVPSPLDPPKGCSFHPRCREAIDTCRQTAPVFKPTSDATHWVACHRLT